MEMASGSRQTGGMGQIFADGSRRLRLTLNNKKTPWIVVAAVSALVHAVNLVNYPAWFFDEGAYLTYSRQWAVTGRLGYFEHPFGVFLILGALFLTVNPVDYLVPRILMVVLSALDGILLYKIAGLAYSRGRTFAFVASMIYVATPLSARYLRLVVVDNFMTTFLLGSVLLILAKPRDRVLSALLFGAALISKQPAIFFLPAILFFLWRQKRPVLHILTWIGFAAVPPIIWLVYGLYEVGLSSVISSQLILTTLTGERAVSAGALIIQRISSRDPFTFLGLAGIIWALYKRDSAVTFPLAYLGSFVVLLLKISTVYLIPAIPFFALVGARFAYDMVDLIPRLSKVLLFRRAVFGIIVIALIASSLFLVTTQSPAVAQRDAMSYVVSRNPPGVILSNTYLWLFQQSYPGIAVYDRYAVPWNQLVNKTVYLIVDYPGDLNTISAVPQYERLYNSSTLVWSETTYGYTVQVLNGTVT